MKLYVIISHALNKTYRVGIFDDDQKNKKKMIEFIAYLKKNSRPEYLPSYRILIAEKMENGLTQYDCRYMATCDLGSI